MIQQTLVKILLAPFSLLYGVGVSLRNFLYQKELLKGIRFDIPVISVGNLSIGGAGKTPHIEYLIRLLQPYIYVSTLSRGYKRSTKGFLLARPHHNAKSIGDEPLQFVRKFPGVVVAVAENRSFAVPQMMMAAPHLQAILLDDAFQHRSIEAGLNILLTQYNLPFTQDYLLPSGRLREWRGAPCRTRSPVGAGRDGDPGGSVAQWPQHQRRLRIDQTPACGRNRGRPWRGCGDLSRWGRRPRDLAG